MHWRKVRYKGRVPPPHHSHPNDASHNPMHRWCWCMKPSSRLNFNFDVPKCAYIPQQSDHPSTNDTVDGILGAHLIVMCNDGLAQKLGEREPKGILAVIMIRELRPAGLISQESGGSIPPPLFFLFLFWNFSASDGQTADEEMVLSRFFFVYMLRFVGCTCCDIANLPTLPDRSTGIHRLAW